MRRLIAIGIVWAAAACGAGAGGKTSAAGHATTLELDYVGSWSDPANDYPGEAKSATARSPTVNADAPAIAIVGATVLTATGDRIESGTIVLEGGAITKLGANVTVPTNAQVIDGKG